MQRKDICMKISFDDLMDCVTYVDCKLSDLYRLKLDGECYEFKDTAEIVPFVEKKLGYEVVF